MTIVTTTHHDHERRNGMKAYKMCRMRKDGTLGPMFVGTDEIFPIGVWVTAQMSFRRKLDKVYSRLGWLKFRPGLHFAAIPYAPHIGIKENGVIKYMHDDVVWCECEITDEIDYTLEAHERGMRNGKFNAQKACLDYIPVNGFYWYTTNPNAKADWLIAGGMRIVRVLDDEECARICAEHGVEFIPHRKVA